LVEFLIQDNVRVIEVRFCPSLHTCEGLNNDQIVQAVIKGYSSGVKNAPFKVIGGIIICSLRSLGVEHSKEMVDLAYKYFEDKTYEESVVGWDIAGHEGLYPLQALEQAMIKCKNLKLPMTIHAGEWGLNDEFETVSNLKLAAKYADRIGHALTLS